MTVYNYIYNGLEPLKQGDILRNIPYISPEFLIKSTPNDNKPTQNQSNEILTQVITQGDIIQIETFISSTFGILATQDCDIRPEYNLTFYPLSLIEPSEKKKTKTYFDQKVRKPTRTFYLPRLKKPTFSEIGPFHVLLQYPFTLPYEIIRSHLENCWFARIHNYANRVFIGKLTHNYSRLGFEELIFAENYEIVNYLEEFKSKNKNNRRKIISKIEEIKTALIVCNRQEDIIEISFNSFHD